MSSTDAAIEAILGNIKRSEMEILDLYRSRALRSSPHDYEHLFLFGIARRALAQSRAFRQLIEDRNTLVAASVLRLQLDTVLRLYALFWVADPVEFAKGVFEGKEVYKFKDDEGKVMNDARLHERLSRQNKWVSKVYKETSGYIHFSNRHIIAALDIHDPESGRGEINLAPTDPDKPLSYYGEVVRAFLHINMMIPVAAEDWFDRLDMRSEAR